MGLDFTVSETTKQYKDDKGRRTVFETEVANVKLTFELQQALKQLIYEDYLKDLVDGGYFEDAELDINLIIDNLYINDTTIMDRKMLDDNDIEVDDSEKVLAKNEDKDLYLVGNY